jgi:hypothetical protein
MSLVLVIGLLDWENSGWYPEHWDYITFFERPCKHMDCSPPTL